jgi:hypothetical protein
MYPVSNILVCFGLRPRNDVVRTFVIASEAKQTSYNLKLTAVGEARSKPESSLSSGKGGERGLDCFTSLIMTKRHFPF